ncbi:hypothetical protein PYW08_010498 [Mythimna loreyi]|uniref:Uncharacterized protein n=1 Tax=Mythimna loreyi TaxID=667449 RepID=A0ACC2Q586_9NEOP|nr:hypothetical protein PYW08_010498 [Mythimna loreyi]
MRVLVLLALLIGYVHSFSWDFVMARKRGLDFYYNGTVTHREELPCGGYIYWITDQEIERARLDGSEREVLFDDKVFDRRSLTIDQRTQKIYWTEKKISEGVLTIESANFNGSNRTRLYRRRSSFAASLTVSKEFLYWQQYFENKIFRLSKNRSKRVAEELTPFDSDCVYCRHLAANYTLEEQVQGMQNCEALTNLIPNNQKLESTVSICANYCFQGSCTVSAELQPLCRCKPGYSGKRCELINLCHMYCLNGGVCSLNEQDKPVCECTADYGGVRCDVSICKDYCFEGNCSVSPDGQPKCRCEAGYSGERCEVNVCYEHCLNGGICSLNEEDEPICECTPDYEGQRCEIPAFKDCACAEGDSKVRGNYNNNGESEVSTCHQYCLNGGVCSLDEKREPVCRCPADYEGERCDVPAFLIKCFLYAYKNVPPASLSKEAELTCASSPPVV